MAQTQALRDLSLYQSKTKQVNRWTRFVNLFIFIVSAIICILMITFHDTQYGSHYDFSYAIFLIVLYGLGLIGLCIVTRNLITVLKKFYPQFYYSERKMILPMIIILIVAMISKLAFGAYRVYLDDFIDEFFNESEQKDNWISPTFWSVNFTVAEFVPVSALLLSFWYGLLRRNKVISNRKYSSNSNHQINLDHSPQLLDFDEDESFSENPFAIGVVQKITLNFQQDRDFSVISNSNHISKETNYQDTQGVTIKKHRYSRKSQRNKNISINNSYHE
ncbi:UNKNOWN [Stylonychia lemnae]|uniref:Transmembrane protein n=1 Tax=Stylonychia lemnae TaxID=5949 RepID=A0A078B3R6_STYLE|nr:UNKNOWN [Stylonychia lemnae]|eukprot:CDW89114.1 UNKNOWN [Stylonychia lemnae]